MRKKIVMLVTISGMAVFFLSIAAGPSLLALKIGHHTPSNCVAKPSVQTALQVEPMGRPGSGGGQPPEVLSWREPTKSQNFTVCC